MNNYMNLIGKRARKASQYKIETKIKNNVFVGSNTALVAPITLNNNSIIGAGSVITKNVKSKSLALTRSDQQQIKNYKRKNKK